MIKVTALPDQTNFEIAAGETLLEGRFEVGCAVCPCLRRPAEMLDLPRLGPV